MGHQHLSRGALDVNNCSHDRMSRVGWILATFAGDHDRSDLALHGSHACIEPFRAGYLVQCKINCALQHDQRCFGVAAHLLLGVCRVHSRAARRRLAGIGPVSRCSEAEALSAGAAFGDLSPHSDRWDDRQRHAGGLGYGANSGLRQTRSQSTKARQLMFSHRILSSIRPVDAIFQAVSTKHDLLSIPSDILLAHLYFLICPRQLSV